MIERINAFKTSTGKACATLEEAQENEIKQVFAESGQMTGWAIDEIAARIVNNKEQIIDIITTTATSRPKARKANGAKKVRKPSPAAVNAALQDMKQ